jgi:hypothetical protein
LAAALLGCLAIGVRIVAAVIPIAMLLALLLHSKDWGRRRGRFLIALIPLAFLVLLIKWYYGHVEKRDPFEELDSTAGRLEDLEYVLENPPELLKLLMAGLAFVAGALGMALLPLTLACIRKGIVGRAVGSLAVLALILFVGYLAGVDYGSTIELPLNEHAVWALDTLGDTQHQAPGYGEGEEQHWPSWVAMGIGCGSFAIFLAVLVFGSSTTTSGPLPQARSLFSRIASQIKGRAIILARQLGRTRQPGEAYLIWMIIGHYLLLAILQLFYDRCALELVPLGIVLLLAGKPVLRLPVALVFLALFAGISIVGVCDHLAYNSALWNAVGDLRDSGVPASEIDGGYTVNGWLQYAHPENAHRDEEGNIRIPKVNAGDEPAEPGLGATTIGLGASPLGTAPFSATAALITVRADELPYRVSSVIAEGWKPLKSFPYRRWLGRSGNVYILVRKDHKDHRPEKGDKTSDQRAQGSNGDVKERKKVPRR